MKKILAGFLTFALVFAGTPCVRAEITESLTLPQLAIPESLGKIQERFTGTSSRWVIQIQDVHGHVTAQENIAAILDHLQAVYGIKTVAAEGAWLTTSLPKSWGMPNSREKQLLARGLLDEGYLSGPGYAALFSPAPLTLVGVEDAKLYEQNRRLYLRYLDQRDSVQSKIASWSQMLQQEKNSTYNPDLAAFDKHLEEFRGQVKADAFIPYALSTASDLKIDLLKLDQIALLSKIMDLSSLISKDSLQREAERLKQSYQAKRLSFEELLRSGKLKPEDMEFYPEMQKYVEVMKLQDKLDHQALMGQLDELIMQIKAKLLRSEEEKSLDQQSDQLTLAKRLLSFEATPKDYAQFQESREALTELAKAHQLDEALALSAEFYQLAKKRDDIFFQKLTATESLKADLAIVVGGFHTEGLSAQLRAAGISYVVITPDLAGEAPNRQAYETQLKIPPPNPESQTLSPVLRYFEPSFDERFPRVIQEQAGAKFDLRKAEARIMDENAGAADAKKIETAQGAAAAENFFAKPVEDQKAALQKWLTAPAKNERMILLISAETLDHLTNAEKTPEGPAFWNRVAQNPANTVIVVTSEDTSVPDSALGMPCRVMPWAGESAEAVLASPKFKARFKNDLVRSTAAINLRAEELKEATPVLQLPNDPVSFLIFRMALSNPEMRALISSAEGFGAVREILLQLDAVQAMLKSA